VEVSRATIATQKDSEENFNTQPQKEGLPHLRLRDQPTFQEDGTDPAWPNP
jgi:hypothetical protein